MHFHTTVMITFVFSDRRKDLKFLKFDNAPVSLHMQNKFITSFWLKHPVTTIFCVFHFSSVVAIFVRRNNVTYSSGLKPPLTSSSATVIVHYKANEIVSILKRIGQILLHNKYIK